jgi:hypothetical protein
MANPFPGMDPYLEGDLWPTVHLDLTGEIVRQLAPRLRPKYLVLSSRRVVLATPDETERPQERLPDVGVLHRGNGGPVEGAAVATAPMVANALMPAEYVQRMVEVRDRARRQLVTAIEVVSPTNKRGDGRDDYFDKRRQLLAGPVHLVEIDLIRVGDRFPVDRVLPSVPYFVFVSRADQRPRVEMWPIPLSQPLTSVPIPLLPGDPEVLLDLQAALDTVYQAVGYDLGIDYSAAPPGPLAVDDLEWIHQRLREQGRRS